MQDASRQVERNSRRIRAGIGAPVAVLVSVAVITVPTIPSAAAAREQAGTSQPQRAKARCDGKRATIIGTTKNDSGRRKLNGTKRADVIVALAGNDRVTAGRGDDLLCLGGGSDVGKGGPGNDVFVGGAGDDNCVGGEGQDTFRGCEQTDEPPPPPPPQPGGEPPPPNGNPAAGGDAASTGEDEAKTIPVLANDSDPDGDPLTVTGIGTAGTTGAVSPAANGTAVLYDPRGRFDSLLPGQTATDSFTYSVSDGRGGTATASVAVVVIGAQEPPTVSTTAGATAVLEDASGPLIDNGLTVTDPDNANLVGGTVRISQNFQSGDDLFFVNQNGISGVYNTGTGVLTLSGSSSVANYQTALRSIQFQTTNENPAPSKTVEFMVDDGTATSNAATKTLSVQDNEPTVTTTPGTTSVTEGDPCGPFVDDGITVTDPDNANLEGGTVRISQNFQSGDDLFFVNQNGISGVYNTGTGVLTLSGSSSVANYQTALRSIRFCTTNTDPTTSKTIEFTVSDGNETSAPATKGISVTPVP